MSRGAEVAVRWYWGSYLPPVVIRQIEAPDLAWPYQKVAEQLEAASPATLVWMGFQRVGRGPTDAG